MEAVVLVYLFPVLLLELCIFAFQLFDASGKFGAVAFGGGHVGFMAHEQGLEGKGQRGEAILRPGLSRAPFAVSCRFLFRPLQHCEEVDGFATKQAMRGAKLRDV